MISNMSWHSKDVRGSCSNKSTKRNQFGYIYDLDEAFMNENLNDFKHVMAQ